MKKKRGVLIAIDGVNGAAVARAAKRALPSKSRLVAGISWWDASGLFGELGVAGEDAGQPSARTLLLLYASDLAFRLRWEIEPALAKGRTVVAAQYVDTAISLGRAAGLAGGWLTNLFGFAVPPDERRLVDVSAPKASARPHGFAEFSCAHLAGCVLGFSHRQLVARTRAHLIATEARRSQRG